MPNGVLTLLDAPHTQQIETLWQEMTTALGQHPEPLAPFAHFTIHGAQHYDLTALHHALLSAAMHTAPFTITTSGLGIFTGPKPVLYISVVKSPQLIAFHERIWTIADQYAHGASAYYSPNNWMPHITLAHSGLNPNDLPKLIALLQNRNFQWEIEVNNLAFTDTKEGQPHAFPKYTMSLCADGACE